jgi:two-component system sensor histidine kinase RegB
MVIITSTFYTVLIGYNVPLPSIEPFPAHAGMHQELTNKESHYFNLHIFGMWFGFVFSACMVAFFVGELAKTLGERERNLADAREKELRNEHVISLGSLAASAAHDMSTPLGTMAIITHEMAQTYPEHRFPDLQEKVLVMKNQIHRCKEALSVMSASAGELRAESGKIMELVDYIDEVLNQWRTQKPNIKLNLFVDPQTPETVQIIAERSLTLALINILNNAAEASPRELGIELHVQWNDQEVNLKIIDFGPGLSPEIIKRVGREPFTTKKNGLGVGLFLTYSTINRLGGEIHINNNNGGGGACIEITLPLITDRKDYDRTGTG